MNRIQSKTAAATIAALSASVVIAACGHSSSIGESAQQDSTCIADWSPSVNGTGSDCCSGGEATPGDSSALVCAPPANCIVFGNRSTLPMGADCCSGYADPNGNCVNRSGEVACWGWTGPNGEPWFVSMCASGEGTSLPDTCTSCADGTMACQPTSWACDVSQATGVGICAAPNTVQPPTCAPPTTPDAGTPMDAGSVIATVVTGQSSPGPLVADDNNLYWAGGGSLFGLALSAPASASALVPTTLGQVYGMEVLTPQWVGFALATPNGGPVNFDELPRNPSSDAGASIDTVGALGTWGLPLLATDGTYLYAFTSTLTSSFAEVGAITTNNPAVGSSGGVILGGLTQPISALASDGTNLFYATTATDPINGYPEELLMKGTVGPNLSPTIFAQSLDQAPQGPIPGTISNVVIAGGNVYWLDCFGTGDTYNDRSCTVTSLPLAGGTTPTTYGGGLNDSNLVVDSTGAYWFERGEITAANTYGNSIFSTATGASSKTLRVANGCPSAGDQMTGLAINTTTLYWSCASGTILSTPKE